MTKLFEPERHLRTAALTWSEADARAAIAEIVADAVSHFDPANLWPVHPQDDMPFPTAGLYLGASGVVLALETLKREGAADYEYDFRPVLPALIEHDRLWLQAMPLGVHASLLMGDLGPMLVAMRLAPGAELADRIFARCTDNNALPPLELVWGTPGSMLACLFLHQLTGEQRFVELYRTQAARLLSALDEPRACRLWTIDIYGSTRRQMGVAHGFAGNMFPLIRGWRWLDQAQQALIAAVAEETLAANALRGAEGVNWPTDLLQPGGEMLCQICHGAPGIVTAFADAPFSTPELEQLLVEGGRLIWTAGPLAKGSNFCHGTGGNAQTLVRLYERTGDALWLDRARTLAMDAVAQCRAARAETGRGRYSLWSGDPGLAICLLACLRGEARFPGLDAL